MASHTMLQAVSNPKVKSVPLKSLSIVLGTPTTFTPFSWSFCATESVSSPPMATSASILCLAIVSMQRSMPSGRFDGFVLDVRKIVPPRGRMPATVSRLSGMLLSSIRPRQPSRKPISSSW